LGEEVKVGGIGGVGLVGVTSTAGAQNFSCGLWPFFKPSFQPARRLFSFGFWGPP